MGPHAHSKALSLIAALTLLVAGCGDDSSPAVSNDEAQIRDTVVAWYQAAARADGAKLCELLTPAARNGAAEGGPNVVAVDGKLVDVPKSCEIRIARVAREEVVNEGIAPGVNNASVTKVDILEESANATTRLGKGEQLLTLQKINGAWHVNGSPGS